MSHYSSKWIKVSEPYPQVLHVEFARAPVNAFSVEFLTAYGHLLDTITSDGYDVRALVISSVFPKIFVAGLDLNDAASLGGDGADTSRDNARAGLQFRKKVLSMQHSILAPERASFPVIAATHGHIIGLGVDMIAACDIRYTASNSSFSIKEVDIGLAPDIGGLAFLTKITGNQSLIRELTYTARPFSAAVAEKAGLVSRVVEGGRDEVVKAALELAKFIASKSPVAVSSSKHLITHSRDHNVPENLAYTGAWQAAALMTNDIGEALRATSAKEAPKFVPLNIQTRLSKL
ncbi:Delta2-dienoyl-CoA-isomerase [Crassisporium funariophilum]|nr:Delta2-dienoyl-CoA-isomerase [Crassisporium funariophilum]